MLLLLLFLPNVIADDAVEVAADKVAQHDADVEDKNLRPEEGIEVQGHTQIIKSINLAQNFKLCKGNTT